MAYSMTLSNGDTVAVDKKDPDPKVLVVYLENVNQDAPLVGKAYQRYLERRDTRHLEVSIGGITRWIQSISYPEYKLTLNKV